MKKASKKKETRIKMEIFDCYKKLVTIDIDRNDKILGFDLVFVG